MACGVKTKKVQQRSRLVTELDKDRSEQSSSILFLPYPEVEQEVCYVYRFNAGGAFDILYDGRTNE
jgi:hypothetical protein